MKPSLLLFTKIHLSTPVPDPIMWTDSPAYCNLQSMWENTFRGNIRSKKRETIQRGLNFRYFSYLWTGKHYPSAINIQIKCVTFEPIESSGIHFVSRSSNALVGVLNWRSIATRPTSKHKPIRTVLLVIGYIAILSRVLHSSNIQIYHLGRLD